MTSVKAAYAAQISKEDIMRSIDQDATDDVAALLKREIKACEDTLVNQKERFQEIENSILFSQGKKERLEIALAAVTAQQEGTESPYKCFVATWNVDAEYQKNFHLYTPWAAEDLGGARF